MRSETEQLIASISTEEDVYKRQQYYTILHEKALKLDSLQSRLEKIYGKCDDLLETVVAGLEQFKLGDEKIFKACLLTNESVEKWEEYKKAAAEGRILPVDAKR